MRYPILLFLFTLLPVWVLSQSISGRVVDQDGKPLAFATIFVQETGSGTVTNGTGKYELRIEPGTYHISFQFLGYKSEQETIVLGATDIHRDIVLQKQAYLLDAAEVDGGREDPAYKIMRKAIAMSSFHRQQVDHYTCEVYLKGGGRVVDMPWIVRKTLEKEGVDTSAVFLTESVSEITYDRPGHYREHVVSIRTSGDVQNTSPMNYINSSFYEPEIAGLISPFSPKAFAYYKFRYIRTFTDRGYQIDQVKVIPRSKGEDVFAGNIYIVEGLWAIHSIDLSFVTQGIHIDVNQTFAPVVPQVWMPISHKYNGRGKILGVVFEFEYLATVSNYHIELNPELATPEAVLDEKTEDAAIEARDEGEIPIPPGKMQSETEKKLMEGKDITQKELRKLMHAYEKQERRNQDQPMVIRSREVKIDSTAANSDPDYWALKRPIPLTEREKKGYQLQDSIALIEQKNATGDTLTGSGGFKVTDLVWGNTYELGNDHYLRLHNNLISIRFNTVDGWNFKYGLTYFKRFDADHRLDITPVYRYAFARNQNSGKITATYRYRNGLKEGKLYAGGGYYYSQFNKEKPIATFTDMISSLIVENHFMRVYDRAYAEAGWEQSLTHNFSLSPSLTYARRIETYNNTDQVWFPNDEKEYPPNAPVNIERPDTHFGESRALKLFLKATWKPGARYYRRGEKYYPANRPPVLTARYEKAVPGVFGSSADYDLAALEIKHRFDLNLLGKVAVRAEAGKFLRNENMDFMDFQHFMGNQTIFTRFAQMRGYSIAPYYDFSTHRSYLSSHINYEFRQFLLTNIRVLRLTGVKENININYLLTPEVNNYVEVGYSIDNLLRFFRIDVTGAFLDGRYYDFRIQIGITTDLISIGN